MTNTIINLPQIQLGLCNPPEPIYLYVGHIDTNGETYLWYQYDIETQKQQPVKQRGLTGYISQLRLTSKEFKGKEQTKLDIFVQADELYVIRSGLETNFSKTLLLALSCVSDLRQPVTIAVTAGEENVVFARMYDPLTRQRFRAEWNPDTNWLDLVNGFQQRLGQSLPPEFPVQNLPPALPVQPSVSNSDRVKAVRSLTNHSTDDVKSLLASNYGTNHPKHLTSEQCNLLIEALISDWYNKVNLPGEFPVSSFRQHLQQLQQQGFAEADAISSWMTESTSAT